MVWPSDQQRSDGIMVQRPYHLDLGLEPIIPKNITPGFVADWDCLGMLIAANAIRPRKNRVREWHGLRRSYIDGVRLPHAKLARTAGIDER